MYNKTKELESRRVCSHRITNRYMKIKLLTVFFLLLVFCSGCWSSREIDTLAISIAAGIDQTERGYLVTQQVINPKVISAMVESKETPVVLFTQEGNDLFSAIRKITQESPRKIYNSHLRMIILGEELARNGITDVLDFYMRNHEFRTDFYFAVARGTTAKELLEILTPLEFIPGIKLHHSLEIAENHSGISTTVDIIELTQLILAEGQNPVIPGIEITPGLQDSDSMSALMTVNDEKRLRYNGVGVFYEDALVGWLSEEETRGYNYIRGNTENTVEYVTYHETDQITFEITRLISKITAFYRDEKPHIVVKIDTDVNIAAMEGELDISKEENKAAVVRLMESKLKEVCQSAVQRTQDDLCCDIFGFGEAVHRKYPLLWKELKNNWHYEFSKVPVDFDITVNLKQLGQTTKPMFRKEE